MTKILVPFKYFVYENAMKVEKIGYYEDELSNVFNCCTQCLAIHDRRSRYCKDCSDEYKAGRHEDYKPRLEKNEKAVEMAEAKLEEENKLRHEKMTLTRFGKVMAILNGSERESDSEVRQEGEHVAKSDNKRGKRKTKAKAGVV